MLKCLEITFLCFQYRWNSTGLSLKPELKTSSPSCAAIPARNEYLASPRCMLIIGPTSAGTSGLRSVSSVGLDPCDALLLWLNTLTPAAVDVVAPTIAPVASSSRGALPAPSLSSFASPVPEPPDLLTWPGAAAASCPSSARSVSVCERKLLSSPPRLISASQLSEVR